MKSRFIFSLIFFSMLICCINTRAQINAKLTLNEKTKSFFNYSLFCDDDFNCGLAQNEKSKISSGFEDEKIQMKVWRRGKDFYLAIDQNLDNKLAKNETVFIKNGSEVNVRIKRQTKSGQTRILPYVISHEANVKNGIVTDRFGIYMLYSLTGVLKYKNCSAKIDLTDMNFDGDFNLTDGRGGSNLHVDMNNDGRFSGRNEHLRTLEIIDFCGQSFLASSLNNHILTLSPTDMRNARVGSQIPQFSFTLLNKETKTSDNLKGNFYLLDFWASWCGPCVKHLETVAELEKKYKNKLAVFTLNVDEAEKRSLAEKIIGENQMDDFSVIRGAGRDDMLWKIFGKANLTGISVPLYVLVDKEGVINYIGWGGEELVDLKGHIEKLLPKD